MSSSSILAHIGRTPLVRLARVAADSPVAIWAKCEHLNPGGSVKDRIAAAIVDDAEARGLLAPGGTLIEATAGNTGVGLALLAAVRGYRLICVMPQKMSLDKRRALRALGAEVVITDNAPPDDPRNFQQVARRLAAERGAFLTDQFAHPANPAIHQATTGPEIVGQLAQEGLWAAAFVAGAGTGGSLSGVGRCLKAHDPRTRVVLADPVGSRLADRINLGHLGADGTYRVEGIGGAMVPPNLDLSIIDEAIAISDEESFATTRRLLREEGLLVGGSSGTAVAAALRLAQGMAPDPAAAVVVLLPDGWDRYASCDWLSPETTGEGRS